MPCEWDSMLLASMERGDHRKKWKQTFLGDGSCQTSPHTPALGVFDPNIIALWKHLVVSKRKTEREGKEECLCNCDCVSVTEVLLR